MTALRPALALVLALSLGAGCASRAPRASGPRVVSVSAPPREPLPPPRSPLIATPDAPFRARPPVVEAGERPPLPTVRREQLANGLTVFGVRQPDPQVVFLLASRAAHEDLRQDQAGISAFLADAIPRGTIVDGRRVDSYLATEGLDPFTYASPDGVGLGVTTGPSEWRASLRALATAVRSPALAPDALAGLFQERAVSIERSGQNGGSATLLLMRRLLFPEQDRFAVPLVGTQRSLAALNGPALQQHYASTFVPGAMALIAIGDLDPDALIEAARAELGDWAGETPAVVDRDIPLAPVEPQAWLIPTAARQPLVTFADRAPPRDHPDAPAFEVLTRIIGGMFTTRLNQRLRQDGGYTYGVHANYESARSYGLLRLTSSVAADRAAEALVAFRAELRRLRQEGPSPEEVQTARTLAVETRRAALEGDRSAAAAIARFFTADIPTSALETEVEAIAAIDSAALKAVAERWLRPDGGAFIVAGNQRVLAQSLNAAGFARFGVFELR